MRVRTHLELHHIRRQLQSNFNLVFDTVPIMLVVTSAEEDSLLVANRLARHFYGWNELEALPPGTTYPEDVAVHSSPPGNPACPAVPGALLQIHRTVRSGPRTVAIQKSYLELEGTPAILHVITDMQERIDHEQERSRTIETQARLLREVHHRVKNNLQLLISLTNLYGSRAHEAGPSFFPAHRRRLYTVASVHDYVSDPRRLGRIRLTHCLGIALVHGQDRHPGMSVSVEQKPVVFDIELDNLVPLCLMVSEAVALRGSIREDRSCTVSLEEEEAGYVIAVHDQSNTAPASHDGEDLGEIVLHALASQCKASMEETTTSGHTRRFLVSLESIPLPPEPARS